MIENNVTYIYGIYDRKKVYQSRYDFIFIELTSYIYSKQNVWFRGKDIAEILGYKDTRHTLKRHVSKENTMIQLCCTPKTGDQQSNSIVGVDVSPPQQNDSRGKYYTFINEPGFYELVFSSKLEKIPLMGIHYSPPINPQIWPTQTI